MEEKFAGAVVGEVALVKHDDAVVEREMAQAVRDREHDAVVALRELVHQLGDLVLGLRIEAARHFVAEQQVRRADHLERQREPALLSAGKHAHLAVGDFVEPDIAENLLQRVPPLPRASSPLTRRRSALSTLSHTVSKS